MYTRLLYALVFLLLFWSCRKMDTGGPTIGSISPTSGLGGNLVTISGSGFSIDPTQDIVTFNGLPAEVISATPTQLIAAVPNGATTGPVTVSLNGRTAKGPVYTISSISITGVNPNLGKTGSSVTISGSGLVNTGKYGNLASLPVVRFNGRQATIVSSSLTQLVVTVPDSAGYGPITLTLDSVTVTGPNFYYLGLNSIGPLTGNAGTLVTITGGFGPTPGQDTVTFNGKPAHIDSASVGKLVVSVPAGDTTGPIVIRANGQVLTGPVFTFVPPPVLIALVPSSGPAGTSVTLQGYNFSTVLAENKITFNGTSATVVSESPGQLVVSAPAGAGSGPVSINVNGQTATGPVYTFQNLSITALNPVNAIPPATVTISGLGFGNVAANDIVSFNGITATVVSVVDTQLVVNVPAGVTTGPVTVQVGGLTANGPNFSTAHVITIAGGTYGLSNGVGTQAQFEKPEGLALDAAGNIFVADAVANNIRKIAPDGTVTNFAGDPNGGSGYTDAQGANALFNAPTDLAFDQQGNLFVADQNNNVIRKIAPDGTVSTFVTMPMNDPPNGLTFDRSGNLYVTDHNYYSNPNVYEFNSSGVLIYTLQIPQASGISGVAVDNQGNIYTLESGHGYVYKNTTALVAVANANNNNNIALDHFGNLVITSYAIIYLLNLNTNVLTMYSGFALGPENGGFQDGPLNTALFSIPTGVKVDAQGNIYVADGSNSAIRKITVN